MSHIKISFSYKYEFNSKTIHDHLKPTTERPDQIAQGKVLLILIRE